MPQEDAPQNLDCHWKVALLETNKGPQEAHLFVHPKRDPGFPAVYRLSAPHPLRPAKFTRANFPNCTRKSFNDYIFTIRKTAEFMKSWMELGSRIETPSDCPSLNSENGASSFPLASPEMQPDARMIRVVGSGRGRHDLGSRFGGHQAA
jgi:hypothetical protein